MKTDLSRVSTNHPSHKPSPAPPSDTSPLPLTRNLHRLTLMDYEWYLKKVPGGGWKTSGTATVEETRFELSQCRGRIGGGSEEINVAG